MTQTSFRQIPPSSFLVMRPLIRRQNYPRGLFSPLAQEHLGELVVFLALCTDYKIKLLSTICNHAYLFVISLQLLDSSHKRQGWERSTKCRNFDGMFPAFVFAHVSHYSSLTCLIQALRRWSILSLCHSPVLNQNSSTMHSFSHLVVHLYACQKVCMVISPLSQCSNCGKGLIRQ